MKFFTRPTVFLIGLFFTQIASASFYDDVLGPFISAKCPDFISGSSEISIDARDYNVDEAGVHLYHLTCYEPVFKNGKRVRQEVAEGVIKTEGPDNPDKPDEGDHKTCEEGSIILPSERVMGERVSIVGAPFDLYYFSDSVQGRSGQYTIRIPLGDTNTNVTGYKVDATYAGGRVYSNTFTNTPSYVYDFVWDGKDVNNDPVVGAIVFDYTVTIQAHGKEIPILYKTHLGTFKALAYGFGSWTPSIYHFYDTAMGRMTNGSGGVRYVTPKVISGGNLMIANQDSSEVYIFNSSGKHLYTKFGITGENKFEFVHDMDGKLTSIVQPYGQTTTFSYSGGVVSQITAPKGQITTLGYNGNDLLTSIADPAGAATRMTYYSTGLMHTFQKPEGQMNTFYFNYYGDLTMDYHSSGFYQKLFSGTPFFHSKVTVLESKMGRQQIYRSRNALASAKEVLMQYEDPDRVYDERRQENSHSILYSDYKTVTNYKSNPRFPSNGQYVGYSSIIVSGVGVGTYFDEKVTLTDDDDPFSVMQILKSSNTKGKSSTSTYDGATREWTTVSSEGRTAKVKINQYERPVETQQATLMPVKFSYNSSGYLSKIEQGSRVSTYNYDSNGNLIKLIGPTKQTTAFRYDSNGREIETILPDLRSIRKEYDKNGNLLSITPPGRPKHSFIVNAFEAIKEYLPPALGGNPIKTQYFYNGDNKISKVIRPDGQAYSYVYSDFEGPDKISSPLGDYFFEYLEGGKISNTVSADGSRVWLHYKGPFKADEGFFKENVNIVGTVVYARNDEHLPTRIDVIPATGNRSSVGISYDKDDFFVRKGWMSYDRGSRGEITRIKMDNAEIRYAYSSDFGELSKIEHYQFGYKSFAREFKRDKLGRISYETTGSAQGDYFLYDVSGKFIGRQSYGAQTPYEVFKYDSNGNRVYSKTKSGEVSATYDNQDRLLTWGNLSFTYNANGDLASKTNTSNSEVTTCSYDVFGNLKQVVLPSTDTVEYGNDGFMRRSYRKVNGTVQSRYLYEDQLRITAELDDSGALIRRYVYGSNVNVPDQMIFEGNRYILVKDSRGSVVKVVNSRNGDTTQELAYDSWGKVIQDTNPGFQPFGYAGGVYDPLTGLTRFGARDYDAETGLWTTKDPIRFNGGDTNLYSYGVNDPINNIDPRGTVVIDLTGGMGPRTPAYNNLNGNPNSTVLILPGQLPSGYYGNTNGVKNNIIIDIDPFANKGPGRFDNTFAHELEHAQQIQDGRYNRYDPNRNTDPFGRLEDEARDYADRNYQCH
jgi:RHS repeat-associated protein